MFRALHNYCVRSLIHFNLAYSTFVPATSISLPRRTIFPGITRPGKKSVPGFYHIL
jgi:hypothetical protein